MSHSAKQIHPFVWIMFGVVTCGLVFEVWLTPCYDDGGRIRRSITIDSENPQATGDTLELDLPSVSGVRIQSRTPDAEPARLPGPIIPPTLWFTYRINLLSPPSNLSLSPVQKRLAQNIHRIIALHPGVNVEFMDDKRCMHEIISVDVDAKWSATILAGFLREKDGSMKGDVCRGVAMLNHGGYYMDIDIVPLIDVRTVIPRNVSFTSCLEARHVAQDKPGTAIFQAFTASARAHPIIVEYVRLLADHYSQGLDGSSGPIGVRLMALAANKHGRESSDVFWLQEEKLGIMESNLLTTPVGDATLVTALGKTTPRLGGVGCCCDFVVYDPRTIKLVFYSRMMGASKMCYNKTSHFTTNEDKYSLKIQH
eukprot:m.19955 g.19955  ORF g.19955 m.19955 type:complete len:367 (-) comp12683_c0_seq1:65-1165(-)